MASPQNDVQSISMSNTKKEMLAAYQELVEKLEQERQIKQKPEEKIKEREKKQVVQTAEEWSSAGVTQKIGDLKVEVGRLISSLSDQIESYVAQFNHLKQAVEAKESELHEIYEIQKQASSLRALIEAQNQRRQEFEQEMQERKEASEDEISRTRDAWEQEKKLHEAEVKERDAQDAKRREREKEEYVYAFKREQQLARDKFEDQKAKQERELALKKEEVEKDLAEREAVIKEREASVDELQQRIDALEAEKKKAVEQAIKETTERLQGEFKTKEEFLKKEFSGEKNVLDTRIQSLEQTVKEQREHIDSLSKQLDKAAGQVQDIAVRAIEGSSHSKIVADLEAWLSENRRSGSESGKVDE